MHESGPVTRRSFLALATSAAVSVVIVPGCGRFQPQRSLAAGEFATLEAIADGIIPPDQDVGGKDAAVALFIETQLRGPYARYAATYHTGLSRLDATAQRLEHASFVTLPAERQTAVLAALEKGAVPNDIWPAGEAADFFRLVCDHCMQGYYGSPRHGGNRDFASWKMLGLPYPQVVGRVVS
jgi:gluconate 2-dehydrogenase gamma chain